MPKRKVITTRNSTELARVLSLKASNASQWEVQANLLTELKEIVRSANLTHAEVARKSGTSRTRITSILNGNLKHVSTDHMIRVIRSLGYAVNITVSKAKIAA